MQVIQAIKLILAKGIAGSGYLIASNNLSDLADVKKSRGHLGLGTSALCDITTSPRDTAPGRVLKTGDYGIGTEKGIAPAGIDFQTYPFIQDEYLFADMSKSGNIPKELDKTAFYFITVHGLHDSDNGPGLTMIKFGDPDEIWTMYASGRPGNRFFFQQRSYNTGYKPTAADVGAYTKAQADARFLARVPDINEIRAYAMAWYNGNAEYGDSAAGSALSLSTADGMHSGSLPGTWRCMGETKTVNDAHKTTLWQRIA